jgi:hypothetical protein
MEEISFSLLPVSLEKGRLKKEGFKKDEGGIFFFFFPFLFLLIFFYRLFRERKCYYAYYFFREHFFEDCKVDEMHEMLRKNPRSRYWVYECTSPDNFRD